MPIPDSHREIESAFQQLKWLTQDTEKDLSEQQQKQELFVFQYQETLRIQGKERPFCTMYFWWLSFRSALRKFFKTHDQKQELWYIPVPGNSVYPS